MDVKYTQFVTVLQRLDAAIKDRHRIAANAIGYACACNSPLPSAEVECAETYFKINVAPFAQRVISGFNEATVIDTAASLDFARKYWLLRYEAVHKCPRMDCLPGDFFCSVFGVPKFFSPDDVEFCNKFSQQISYVYSQICGMIKDLFVEG